MAKQRSLQMLVRVAADETEIFRRAADLDGLSLSAWVRSRLLAVARLEVTRLEAATQSRTEASIPAAE
jgi:uncharacterized protein (DUF1778 family)